MEASKLDKKAIQEAILNYCESKDISRKELATLIGVNPATISKIINNKWENISDRQWRQIESEVQKVQFNNLFNTHDMQTAYNLCQAAQEKHIMAGLTADTGMGKTTALTAYSVRPNTYYYYIDATISPRVFLKDLLRQCGMDYEGNINDMLQTLALRLNSTENPLILIDECAKMSEKMMLTIHSLRDRTKQNCGIVLAGMPDFKKRLKRYADKGKTGYGEFLRRINMWQELQGLTPKEINGILVQNGITDPTEQKNFRHLKRFGDLQNEIDLYLFDLKND